MMRTILSASLALAIAACAAPVAIMGSAGIVSVVAAEEWKANASARWFDMPPAEAWEHGVRLLEDESDAPVAIDEEALTAQALVNPHQFHLSVTETINGGARVSMSVRTYALWDRQEAEAWLARFSKHVAALD